MARSRVRFARNAGGPVFMEFELERVATIVIYFEHELKDRKNIFAS